MVLSARAQPKEGHEPAPWAGRAGPGGAEATADGRSGSALLQKPRREARRLLSDTEGGCGAEAAGGLAPGETAAGSGLGARAEAAGGVAPSETAAGSGLRARAEAAGGAAPGETAAGRGLGAGAEAAGGLALGEAASGLGQPGQPGRHSPRLSPCRSGWSWPRSWAWGCPSGSSGRAWTISTTCCRPGLQPACPFLRDGGTNV